MPGCGGQQPHVTYTIPVVWWPTYYLHNTSSVTAKHVTHNTSSVAANNHMLPTHHRVAANMLPPQYQYVAANNHVLPPQCQQCGGQQPRVTHNNSSVAANNHCDGQQPRVTSTIPVVLRPTTTCYLHNTSSVAANNHVLPTIPVVWRPTTTCYLHNTSSGGQQPRVTSTMPAVWRPTTTCYLHTTSSVAANNNMLPLQHQQWWLTCYPQYQQCGGQHVTSIIPAVRRPTTTCYLHIQAVAANNHVLPPQCQNVGPTTTCYPQCQEYGGQQPRVTSTITVVWRPTCYLHNTSSVAANNHISVAANILPPQYSSVTANMLPIIPAVAANNHVLPTMPVVWRPTTTCYLHNTSSVAANNHVLPPQYQCGGQQPRVTHNTSSVAANNHVTSTIPAVWRPTTTCYLHNTSSVRPTTTCYLHNTSSVAPTPTCYPTIPAVWRPTTTCYPQYQ
ncbi:hypothetical protein Hamer_G030047 [Homarus americanus]|uniref:Uncharacterized protein n=1 Tax=Homarus americanus TaxID=6706 RepID=A0A8J5NAV4_HOMAM|nr:hypothetical protein Hamer_G030047 [Homarus americanus]